MDGGDRGDDRTFRVNFTSEGIAKLRERVTEKLKEFMGDYTDDTLVEYVIVLLKNGRRKEEAKNELNVFLGDDSESFVTWLWDHLGSNINLYVQMREPYADGGARIKPSIGEKGASGDQHKSQSELQKEKPDKSSRTRHSRDWKGLLQDVDERPIVRSSTVGSVGMDEQTHGKVSRAKRSLSPGPDNHRKRSRAEERQQKREIPQTAIDAPRRLLQFAVRDAVATSRPSNINADPSLKRLRSVVSTSAEESTPEEHPRRIRTVARVPPAMATAIKAAAEAANQVAKFKPSGNVFDRLGRATDVPETSKELAEYGEDVSEDRDNENDLNSSKANMAVLKSHHQGLDYSQDYDRRYSVVQNEVGMGIETAFDGENYDDNVRVQRGVKLSQMGPSWGSKIEGSSKVGYAMGGKTDEVMPNLRKDQDLPHVVPIVPTDAVDVSINLNTWKAPKNQEARKALDMESHRSAPENELIAAKPGLRPMKENSNPVSINGNVKPNANAQAESQRVQPSTPGLYSSGPPTDDADSRTIFVNNVHFAATKDSLSRHFNKFGEVLKVVILTDAATGQPKGAAYVEFMRKEAAELALSLDGTSFMSRILKVVVKSSAPPEAASTMTWPRIARGSPFSVSRFGRAPYSRAMPGMYRSRLPLKPGARSFQWKRDAQSTPNETSGQASGNSVPSPTARSLTYVRTEPKTNGDSGNC